MFNFSPFFNSIFGISDTSTYLGAYPNSSIHLLSDIDSIQIGLLNVDVSPSIDHPADVTYKVGESGNTITWHPTDANPASYLVYTNNEELISDTWDGKSISINVDGLEVGVYNYTIVVFDGSGNSVGDTVIVIVTESSSSETSTEVTPGLTLLVCIVMVFTFSMLKKFGKCEVE